MQAWVVDKLGVVGRTVLVVVVEEPLERLLDSTEGRGLSPCRLSNRRDKSIFHTGCIRRRLEGSGGRSIGLGLELLLVRQG